MSSKSNPELDDFELEITTSMTALTHPSIAESAVKTNNLATSFFSNRDKGSDLLLPVVRGVSGDYTWIMIERPPQEHKVSYTLDWVGSENSKDKSQEEYSIKLPWLVYILHFEDKKYTSLNSMHIYARNAPIITEDELLYRLPLPNIHYDSEACAKFRCNEVLKKFSSLTMDAAINLVINTFWDSGFNEDADAATYNDWPEEFRNSLEEGKYYDLDVDDINTYVLDNFETRSIEQVIDLTYTPSYPADPIRTYYFDEEKATPKFQTVGEWLRVFERSTQINYNHLPNPFLSFIKSLL